jgi:hypothetical protein
MADETYPWTGAFTELSADDQLAVAQLVVKGRAVSGTVDDLLARLGRTKCVALLREAGTDRIAGTAAWKTPGTTYRRDKFVAAGAPIRGFETAPELGYVVIAADKRGGRLSGGLVNAIVNEITLPTFATTDNKTMRGNLERSGFTRVGHDFEGKKGDLSLWTIRP